MKPPRAIRLWAAVLLAAALIGAAAWLAALAARDAALQRTHEAARHRLDVLAAELDGRIARFDYLPSLLELNPAVLDLLEHPQDAALVAEVNRLLVGVNATAGAEMLYVVDKSGTARAAADWNRPGTPVGEDLSYRPYVQQALAQGRGRFYGIGVTSRRAGYYLSFALARDGRVAGVAAVKIGFDELEQTWARLPGDVLVTDARGVVILSSREDWKFRSLGALPQTLHDEIAKSRPYGAAELPPLPWRTLRRVDGSADAVELHGRRYLADARELPRADWRLIVLEDLQPVDQARRNAALTGGLAMAVLMLAALAGWQRRRGRAALQAAYAGLEAKVAERTVELSDANRALAEQIEARRAIEAELVHAGKLAALGQLSAGLVHELNQPLAALRTLSDNACVMLERAPQEPKRLEGVRGNLERIAHLVDRLAKLTGQLKTFAHKAPVQPLPVRVAQAITSAQAIVSPRLREQGVELVVDVQPPGLSALADEARLEQVLVNLMGNAIDAMAALPLRRLVVRARCAGEGRCTIDVDDSGPGIRADMLPRLFEPFATSKPAGSGLGLGLMISQRIVDDFGGSLRAGNRPEGGARFTIELRLPDE